MADEDRPSRLDSERVSGDPARELVSRGRGSPEATRRSSEVDNLFFSPADPIAVWLRGTSRTFLVFFHCVKKLFFF